MWLLTSNLLTGIVKKKKRKRKTNEKEAYNVRKNDHECVEL